MSAVLFVLLEIGIAVGVWRLADRARKQQLTARSAALFAGGCAVLLLMLIATDWPLTDWPTPEINAFWDEHGVLSGTVQSVLLFGVGLLSYEAGQLRAQERLDESVTAAGLGGIVDHVVDAEVGLAFLSSPQPPDAHGWVWSPGKPLQWLRQGRDRLSRSAPDRTGDPRTWPATLPETDEPGWRKELVDQCIRRLLVVIRDWTPVIATSRNGTRVLVAVAELRKDLVELEAHLDGDRQVVEPMLVSLRSRARLLAYFLELKSGADPLRPEVLDQLRPAAGDARVLGVGGRPVGARPVRRRVDQGPAGGDRGPQRGRADPVEHVGQLGPRSSRAGGRTPTSTPCRAACSLSDARASASAAARSCSGGTSPPPGDADRLCAAANRRTAVSASPRAAATPPPTRRHWATANVCPRRSLWSSASASRRPASARSPCARAARASVMLASRTTVGRRWPATPSASTANARAVSAVAVVERDLRQGVEHIGGAGQVAVRAHDCQLGLVGTPLALEVPAVGPGHREQAQCLGRERVEVELLGLGGRLRGQREPVGELTAEHQLCGEEGASGAGGDPVAVPLGEGQGRRARRSMPGRGR